LVEEEEEGGVSEYVRKEMNSEIAEFLSPLNRACAARSLDRATRASTELIAISRLLLERRANFLRSCASLCAGAPTCSFFSCFLFKSLRLEPTCHDSFPLYFIRKI
jgi:hypothetical protein